MADNDDTGDVAQQTTHEQLVEETEKWAEKLDGRLKAVSATDDDGAELLENAAAYLQDTAHFKEQDDWVRAFEAVIWGWSWLEIGERLGKIDERTP